MKSLLVSTAIATGLLLGLGASSALADAPKGKKGKPCITKSKVPEVMALCEKGGQKAVKTAMKAMVKKAKSENAKDKDGKENADWNCKSCHDSLKKYTLIPDVGMANFEALKQYLPKAK